MLRAVSPVRDEKSVAPGDQGEPGERDRRTVQPAVAGDRGCTFHLNQFQPYANPSKDPHPLSAPSGTFPSTASSFPGFPSAAPGQNSGAPLVTLGYTLETCFAGSIAGTAAGNLPLKWKSRQNTRNSEEPVSQAFVART